MDWKEVVLGLEFCGKKVCILEEFSSEVFLVSLDDEKYVLKVLIDICERDFFERVKLIDFLLENGFKTPKVYSEFVVFREFFGLRYCVFLQEYVLGEQLSYEFDSLKLAFDSFIKFQKLLLKFDCDSNCGCDFLKYFEKRASFVRESLSKVGESLPKKKVLRVLDFLEGNLERLKCLPCVCVHGSFRLHNFLVDESGDLVLIDFFHDVYFAPRLYEFCSFLLNFSYFEGGVEKIVFLKHVLKEFDMTKDEIEMFSCVFYLYVFLMFDLRFLCDKKVDRFAGLVLRLVY